VYYKLICILYALLSGQKKFILIKSGCYNAWNIEQGFAPSHRNVNYLQDEKAQGCNNITRKENEGSFASRPIELECETKRVLLEPRVPDKPVRISQDLTTREEAELLSFPDKNNDVFSWRTSNLTTVSRDIIEHKLQVSSSARPRKQSLRKMSDKKVVAIKAEVQRLLDAEFIREVDYPSWLANVIMVKKKNGKWRMCTYFTDLNKWCLKDDFLLMRIDKVVGWFPTDEDRQSGRLNIKVQNNGTSRLLLGVPPDMAP
jgi:hypothetical protein